MEEETEDKKIDAKCEEVDGLLSKLTEDEIELIDVAVRGARSTQENRPIVLDIPGEVAEADISLLYYPRTRKIGNVVVQRLARLYRTAARQPRTVWGKDCHHNHSMIVETMANDLSQPTARKFLEIHFGTPDIGDVLELEDFHCSVEGTKPTKSTHRRISRTELSPFLYHQTCYPASPSDSTNRG